MSNIDELKAKLKQLIESQTHFPPQVSSDPDKLEEINPLFCSDFGKK